MKKKAASPKRTLAVAAATLALGTGAFFWLSGGKGTLFRVPAYTVLRVIDGDTFETTEHQHIRLSSTEAPELGLCGSEEAKNELERLVIGRPIYLKIIYRDPYQRLVSQVYTTNLFVNEEMIKNGYAYYYRRNSSEGEELKQAGEYAREKKTGIYSLRCTQMVNQKKSSCNIKGNTRNGNIYYLPNCGVYHNVEVQLYLGDQWFCSEKEAQAAGFRKPSQCP